MLVLGSAVYVFGIVRAGVGPSGADAATKIGAVEFGPLRVLTDRDVSAVVSDLLLPEGTLIETLLQDPRQAEILILHHHRVLGQVAGQAAALPLRFGSLFSDDGGVREMLAKRRDRFLQAIAEIDGAAEWGLKIFCDRSPLGLRLCDENPRLAGLKAEIAGASEGKRFFLERRLEHLVDDEIGRAITQYLERAGRLLSPLCRRRAEGRIQPARLHGHGSEMVFNGMFLIDETCKDGFLLTIDELRQAPADSGFEHEITGPWPPYSFVDGQLNGDGYAA